MREIKLTQGYVTQVDDEDYEKLNQFNWHYGYSINKNHEITNKYAVSTMFINNKWRTVRMHRFIMDAPINMEIDHIDHNGLNNQKNNLRICTKNENQRNRKPSSNSGFIGVYHSNNRIISQIKVNGKLIHLGTFKTEIEAAKARDNASIKYFGDFANLNFKS